MSNKFILYEDFITYNSLEMLTRSREFAEYLKRRRTVRDFSSEPVDIEIVKNCIKAAASAPSGANKQPWHFVLVKDKEIKHRIRIAAEKEEAEFYSSRAPEEWLEALEPFGTNPQKPFLEEAPYLIVIFEQKYGFDEKGNKIKNYYVKESVGIAVGMLITALHYSGLATLTHTPSPMNFLNSILNRPENEKPFLILVVGKPAEGVKVPDIDKKKFEEVCTVL